MSKVELDLKRLPRHVAVIMDGNGRWADRHGLTHAEGHEAGAKSVRAITEGCRELGGIETLTLYTFSTENWSRSESEVNVLFALLSKYVKLELDNLHREDIRFRVMGRTDQISPNLLSDLEHAAEVTRNNRSMVLNLAVNYGGRAELTDACKTIAGKVEAGQLGVEDIDEDCISEHLYMPEIKDIDLLIRTSGELRISNFLLWQISYSEIVVTRTLWPDFRKRHLYKALKEYQFRNRRFGKRI